MKTLRLAMITVFAVSLFACETKKEEPKMMPEELPVNQQAAPMPDTMKVDTMTVDTAKAMAKPASKVLKADPNAMNIQKKENRDVPTTQEPVNVQKKPSRE
jgi:hypothetical protein